MDLINFDVGMHIASFFVHIDLENVNSNKIDIKNISKLGLVNKFWKDISDQRIFWEVMYSTFIDNKKILKESVHINKYCYNKSCKRVNCYTGMGIRKLNTKCSLQELKIKCGLKQYSKLDKKYSIKLDEKRIISIDCEIENLEKRLRYLKDVKEEHVSRVTIRSKYRSAFDYLFNLNKNNKLGKLEKTEAKKNLIIKNKKIRYNKNNELELKNFMKSFKF
jgi:hypothetical protein